MKRLIAPLIYSAILLPFMVKAQVDTIISTYNGAPEIRASKSIMLKPGFMVGSGQQVRIYIGAGFANCLPFVSTASANQNYVKTTIFKMAGVKPTNIDSARSTCEVNQSIQYFDGLGRGIQTVGVMASPYGKDIVQPMAYDAFGREQFKYQPYATGTGTMGSYRADALQAGAGQAAFYNTQQAGMTSTAFPFSQTVFEPSPLNRVAEQGAPGAVWQPIANSNTGNTVRTEYGVNAAGDVQLWTVNANGATALGNYPAGRLYRTTVKDENWKFADGRGGTTDEYKDLEGRVVLKRIWETDAKSLSTYYVYDLLGNLRYVLPPAVNGNGQSTISTFDETQPVFSRFIYGYHYDGRKRITEKKLPGKGWEYMVYNAMDQMVLSQDANQRAGNQWLFTKYDALGRSVITGLYQDGNSRASLQISMDNLAMGNQPLWEERDSTDASGTGYTNRTIPMGSVGTYLSINYYDDYDFLGNTFVRPNGTTQVGSARTKGLLTGTKIGILGTSTMLLTVNYYDGEGRVIDSRGRNHLGGTDVVENTYSFAGELKFSTRTHTVASNPTPTVIANRYEYDHMGRKKATWESINGATDIVLSRLDYNELGQLLTKNFHSIDNGNTFLDSTRLVYNERGWLKNSTSGQFSFQLNYNDGTIPQFNGNISNQLWGPGSNPNINTFTYSYDKLNRLKLASSPNLSESIGYDVMGNIDSLTRDGFGTNRYTGYNGNQLTQISGFTNSSYTYDANGNMLIDSGKGITLAYNYLNLPSQVTGNQNLSYTYSAAGEKLKKRNNTTGESTDYIKGIQHRVDGSIDIILTEDGLARNNNGNYSYEYTLTDHLGNNRTTFYKNPSGSLEVLQRDDYYAFGLRKRNLAPSNDNKYLYNGKEIQNELGGQYDYGARFYDPIIARWSRIDNKTETYETVSPYVYAVNDPVNAIDPDGNLVIFVNGFIPLHWYKQDNHRYNPILGYPNPNYTPYPPSRDLTEGYPYLVYNNRNRPYDYWDKIDDVFMNGYNDKHSMYINASSDNTSSAKDRFNEGQASANDLIAKLDNGDISLSKGETIKIVGHSQGGAFAAGMASVLSKNEKYASILREVVYLEPHQPADFSHPASIKGTQISSPKDKVASIWNFLSPLKGKTSFSWIKGVNNRYINKNDKGDYLGGHSITSNLDEIIAYFKSLGIKVNER